MRFESPIRSLVITSWVGSLWTVGYLVAPTLFITLSDRVLAGTIAGRLFRVEAWLSLVAGAFLLLLFLLRGASNPPYRVMFKLVAAMVLCTLIGYFALQPFMAALREAAAGGAMEGAARTRFGLLHGVASAIYLVQSLLGIMLVLKNAGMSTAMPTDMSSLGSKR